MSLSSTLDWPIQFCVFLTAATYIVSVITDNVSQVDRLWTFLPAIYTAYYALLPLFPTYQPFLLVPYNPLGSTDYSPRALLMFALVFIWMCRLSYNTQRRGLFNPYVPAPSILITNLTLVRSGKTKTIAGQFFANNYRPGYSKSLISRSSPPFRMFCFCSWDFLPVQ